MPEIGSKSDNTTTMESGLRAVREADARLGERSIGHMDQGAESAVLLPSNIAGVEPPDLSG